MSQANYRDVLDAFNNARRQIELIEQESSRIGSLAMQPTILMNMSPYQLRAIKRQIKNFNMKTGEWK